MWLETIKAKAESQAYYHVEARKMWKNWQKDKAAKRDRKEMRGRGSGSQMNKT